MAEPTRPTNANVVALFDGSEIDKQRKSAARMAPRQLVLQLEGQYKLTAVVTDRLHGATFVNTLYEVKPQVVIDLRFAPHFNFTAVESRLVRSQLDLVGSRYVQYTIPFHEFGSSLLKHDPNRMAANVAGILRDGCAPETVIMVLLQDQRAAKSFLPFLSAARSNKSGFQWETEVIE